ncbi:MAG: hypothetical protein LBL81_05375, partial [Tannerella sp.]|nr:hypothetical protein [Tannerella sp.]
AGLAYADKDYATAKQYYEQVIQSGDTRYREEAWARKAGIEYDAKDYRDALASFKQLKAVAEAPANQQAARLGILRSGEQSAQWQDALDAANELLASDKLSPEIGIEARYVRAKAYLATRQARKALPDLEGLSKDTRTVQGAEAKYLLAQYYYDNRQDAQAEQVLKDFIANGTPHAYWLARGFILLSDIYARKGEDFQAQQYLQSLRNNYKGNDDIDAMIENRLAKLKNQTKR